MIRIVYLANGQGCFTPTRSPIKSRERLELEIEALSGALLVAQAEIMELRARLLAARMESSVAQAMLVVANIPRPE